MSIAIDKLKLDRLSVGERLDLIEQIWDSLPKQVSANDVPQWHLAELERRLANAATNPDAVEPWREALATLKSQS